MTPGYDGAAPGPAAQRLLKDLRERSVTDPALAPPPGSWKVDSFAVVPNPVTGKGPVVRLRSGGEERWIPVLTDGDAADLWQRVTGQAPAIDSSRLSPEYERAVGLR